MSPAAIAAMTPASVPPSHRWAIMARAIGASWDCTQSNSLTAWAGLAAGGPLRRWVASRATRTSVRFISP